ncbi:hypothetical protein GBAR_LOCUS4549 [Geodia barretti]|uniref:Uncharacterized protein n=1 Tax=Geodia barretti TaxID=519541 RepID=A0AA35R898_GEOBA|nr:hypothetical protein GBAR_LOCUS4549 [Geodia barretti]
MVAVSTFAAMCTQLVYVHFLSLREAVAFIDILAPPYNPKEGRDCNYYEKMETKEDDKQNISLMPGPNPSWFSCVPLSYNGPCPS